MKLSDIQRDVAVVEAGRWVDHVPGMGDLRLRVRGRENSDWRRLESALLAAVPRGLRDNGRIVPEESDRIISVLLRDAALLDWGNLTDGDGQPILYSKEAATKYLMEPDFRAFRDAVLWAASVVADGTAAAAGDVVKN